MIACFDVSKRLGAFTLQKLSFQIPEGYVCGLVGQNGSGKTSLLHLLLGLYQADEGQIVIDGMTFDTSEKLLRDRIGTVLVEPLFSDGLSATGNGERFGRFYSGYEKEAYLKYLERFRIDGRCRFGSLSKGEMLKCQFAFALACQPKYLFLDEPAANFDPDFREAFWQIIKEYVKDGRRTVFLATHLTEDLDRMADYLIYMEKGRIIFAGDVEQFREKYRMVSGEAYKLKRISKKDLIFLKEKPLGSRALVRHHKSSRYDPACQVTYPSIEEFMVYYSQRDQG